jgi:hypothetical protein
MVTPPEMVGRYLVDRNLTQTPLKIMFEDNVWRSPDWFEFLRSLFGRY